MSNIRALRLSPDRVRIGEFSVDKEVQGRAEARLHEMFPEVETLTTREGNRHIPLSQYLVMEEKILGRMRLAREEGVQEGHKSGYEQGLAEAREISKSFTKAIAEVTGQRQALLADAKQHILDMVLAIARKITFAAVKIDPDITMSIISGAIDELLDKSRIKVKVNPDHLPILEQHLERFLGSDTSIKEFSIEADPRVKYGGCFIETPGGDIDARLDSMYEVIRQAILDEGKTAG